MTKPKDMFESKHVKKALFQLIKEITEEAEKQGDDLHFMTFTLGLKGGQVSVSRAGCRCFACANAAAGAIMSDAMGVNLGPVADPAKSKAVH